MQKKTNRLDQMMGRRIRKLREEKDLRAYELAERAEISASYLSLIEKGEKTPTEEVALRIAAQLDDDPELYVAWVHGARHQDLERQMVRLGHALQLRSRRDLRHRVARGEDYPYEEVEEDSLQAHPGRVLEPASARRRRMSRFVSEMREEPTEPPGPLVSLVLGVEEESPLEPDDETIEVPLLRDGTDPGHDPRRARGMIETLRVDRRLLPRDVHRPFAYRPEAAALVRLGDAIRPGDLVILSSRAGEPDARGIYAVRLDRRIVLSRVVRHAEVLLLMPAGGAGRPQTIELSDPSDLREAIAGAVVATVRTWPTGRSASRPARRQLKLGRAVRIEDDCLVRECDWKDQFGWRPVHRPEDLDYLEANPGMRMRFLLKKDGRVRFALEMTPGEWREALGSYVEGETWRRNGYVVAITHRRKGKYTEQFQPRWRSYVRPVDGAGRSGFGLGK